MDNFGASFEAEERCDRAREHNIEVLKSVFEGRNEETDSFCTAPRVAEVDRALLPKHVGEFLTIVFRLVGAFVEPAYATGMSSGKLP